MDDGIELAPENGGSVAPPLVPREPPGWVMPELMRLEDELRCGFGAFANAVTNLGQHTPPDPDLIATLLDFARAGDEAGFRDLALMRGVPADEIPHMWAGTVKRVGGKT
jgi:hypothetical protein